MRNFYGNYREGWKPRIMFAVIVLLITIASMILIGD